MTTQKEKRSVARIALNLPVDLKKVNMLEHASVDDLSPQGMFIATSKKYPKGTVIELQLQFPDTPDVENEEPFEATLGNSVLLQGEVMWCGEKLASNGKDIIHGIGVRFINLDSDTFERVMSLYGRVNTTVNHQDLN